MSKYMDLKSNAPKIEIKDGAREVVFTTVSAMCDNQSILHFKKDANGEFTVSGRGNSLSNWQMKYDSIDLTWSADEENWDKVISMINSGTEIVSSVRVR